MLTEKNGRSVLFGKTSNQHLQLEGNNHEAGSITEDNYKDKEPKEVLKKYNKQKKKQFVTSKDIVRSAQKVKDKSIEKEIQERCLFSIVAGGKQRKNLRIQNQMLNENMKSLLSKKNHKNVCVRKR